MHARLVIFLTTLVLIGCDGALPLPTKPRVSAASVKGTASVEGKIVFDGPAPEVKTVRNEPCCPGAPVTQLDDAVIVNANGTLANVLVSLEGGPLTEGSALPPPVLDQRFCQYTPHVLGVVVGQPLTIRSSDATLHNVAMYPEMPGESARNFSMSHAGDTASTTFAASGIVRSKCDVHPWMSAVVGVFDNPLFAVTGGDGTFRITGVPDGHYTLVSWHERYGRLERPVDVVAGHVVHADLDYHPPTQ